MYKNNLHKAPGVWGYCKCLLVALKAVMWRSKWGSAAAADDYYAGGTGAVNRLFTKWYGRGQCASQGLRGLMAKTKGWRLHQARAAPGSWLYITRTASGRSAVPPPGVSPVEVHSWCACPRGALCWIGMGRARLALRDDDQGPAPVSSCTRRAAADQGRADNSSLGCGFICMRRAQPAPPLGASTLGPAPSAWHAVGAWLAGWLELPHRCRVCVRLCGGCVDIVRPPTSPGASHPPAPARARQELL